MATYFGSYDGAKDPTDEALKVGVESLKNINELTPGELKVVEEQAKKKAAAESEKIKANTEQLAQAHAAADDVEIGGDGTTTLKNAAGGAIGKVNADGSYERNPSETTTSQMFRDADGNWRWNNGKMAGPAPTPNEGAGIPPGGFAAQKQAEMDRATEELLNKQFPGRKPTESGNYTPEENAYLANYAMQHNAKVPRPVDKTNVGPRVTIVGGSTYKDRHANFIRNNPNAVSPQEREQFLGSGNSANSWGDAVRQQQSSVSHRVLAEQKSFQDVADKRAADKKRNIAERRAAFGSLASMALQGLRGSLGQDPISAGDPRIVPYTDAKGIKHRIFTFSVDKDTIAERNNFRRGLGATGDYGNVFAGIEIGENGRPLLDENGKPMRPKVYADFSPDGQKGKTSDKTLRIFDVPQMERLLGSAYETMGESKEGARNLVYSMMSGWGTNPSSCGNWHENVARINADAKKYATDENNKARIDIAKQKYQQALELGMSGDQLKLVKALLGQRSLTGSQDTTLEEAFAEVDKQYKNKQGKGQAVSENKDNGGDDNMQSTEYPGYTNGKAKRAIAAGWKWNSDTRRFDPPKEK